MKNINLKSVFSLLIVSVLMFSCGKDEPDVTPPASSPIASFQFEISSSNFLEVVFDNFSQNATSYTWDFGDGNSSTSENPTHTYAAGGTYTVALTASNGTESRTFEDDVVLEDPSAVALALHGGSTKVWKLSRNIVDGEFPILVGPENRSEIWWALGINDEIGTRPCMMEEEYIFGSDNSYVYNTNGEIFADFGIWNTDVAGMCIDDTDASLMTGENGEDLTAWGGGTFTYEFDPMAESLVLNGTGAHLGLAKIGTDAEYTTPQEFVRYKVISLETDGPVDKLKLETTIGGGYWQINLVSYDNPSDEPELPGALPVVAFESEINDRTVTFTNNSTMVDSYTWDFGDGNMSSEEAPTHTYANDGLYTVVLTGSNSNGEASVSKNIVISLNSVFSADVLTGGSSKSWKLNPEAGALSVGSFIGGGDFFATSLEDVTTRACAFDDTYTFDNAGNFVYDNNGDLWGEVYMGIDPEGCISEGELPSDAAAWGSGTHALRIDDAAGSEPAKITVTGTGAFIALPKAFNGGEYASGPPSPNASVTYDVLNYINDGSKEILQLTLDISEGEVGTVYWTFTLIAE